MTTLLEKRTALIAEHEAMEKHDSLHWAKEAAAGRKISERLIGFQCDDEVVLVGPCIAKLKDGLQKFVDHLNQNDDDWKERAGKEPNFAQSVAKANRVLKMTGDELRFSTQTWNSLMQALGEVGIQAVLSDGK